MSKETDVRFQTKRPSLTFPVLSPEFKLMTSTQKGEYKMFPFFALNMNHL